MIFLIGLATALTPNLLLLPPTQKLCAKLGYKPTPWMLGVFIFPALALAVMARVAKKGQTSAAKLSTKLFITASVIQALFITAGVFIAVS